MVLNDLLANRLQKIKEPKLRNIQIFYPDPYDLVLMKTKRGEQHDLEANTEICTNENLEVAELIKRYNEEMGHTIGDKTILQLNMFALIETAFGKSIFEKHKSSIKKHD